MTTKFLSEEEKLASQKRIYKFQSLNGMAFNFMGQTPVYLMAINFGATNIELGYISSLMFLTGFILVFLPRLLAGRNLIKVQSAAWFFRGMFVLLYLALYFLEGRAAVILILVVYTLFCTARIIGVVIWIPLTKMVTNTRNRGNFIGQGKIIDQSASVVSKLISFIVTSFKLLSGTSGILLLQVFGVVFNTAAAIQLSKVPCRETVDYHKSRNIFVIFIDSIKTSRQRVPLFIKWISISLMVLHGLTIVFIRKEACFSANYVFLYTLMIALANMLAGLFSKIFADRIGSRPLLIGMNIFLSLCLVLWMLLAVDRNTISPKYIFFILGFFSNFFLLSNNMLVDRVIINTMPENDVFGYNSMISFVTAFFSFLTGVIGGLLMDKGQNTNLLLPNTFSLLFFFTLTLSLTLLILSFRLIDRGSLTAKETVAILFSLEGLRAYSYISKLNSFEDHLKKKTVLLSIIQNDSNIATEEMRSILASPLSPMKCEVLKSLFNHPRKSLTDEVLKEALDSASYNQINAIFALGSYPENKVEKGLIKLLESSNPSVQSNAAKSLSRIGNSSSLETIKKLAANSTDIHDIMNYLIALKHMEESGGIFRDTFNSPRGFENGQFRQTYYSLVSDLLEFKPKLSTIYSAANLKKGSGLNEFFNQTRDVEYFNSKHKDLVSWFKNGDWNNIWDFCLGALNTVNLSEDTPIFNLKSAVVNECKGRSSVYDDALAVLYFTYQILIRNP